MPGAAAVAVVSFLSATGAAAAVITAVVEAAVVGAMVGAAQAAISGGNILEGALTGAGYGAVTGGILGGLGVAAGGAASGGAKVASSLMPAEEVAQSAITSLMPAEEVAQIAASQAPAANIPVSVSTPPPESTGLLSRASGFLGKDTGEILGRTAAGAASSLLKDRISQKEIEYLMERDRLNREDKKIGGLTTAPGPLLPRIKPQPGYQI